MLADVERLFEASPAEQRAFIEQRTKELAVGAPAGELSHIGRAHLRGFIGPEMRVRRHIMVEPIVLDDPDIYTELFSTLKEFKQTPGWKERTTRELVGPAVQRAVERYFGNAYATPTTDAKNRRLYMDRSSNEADDISLREFKGKGIGVCTEKAAVAQNLLTFLGMESELIASAGCRIPEESEEGAHYYILVQRERGPAIYDPTNPRVLHDVEGRIANTAIALYPLEQQQADELLAGGTVTVTHEDAKQQADGTWEMEASHRTYSGPRQR